MATTEPEPTQTPGASKRSAWVWVSGLLLLACVGLLVWALTLQSDRDSAQEEVAALQAQVTQNEQQGDTLTTALKAGYDTLMQQLGAAQADVATAEQRITEAEQKVQQAQTDAQAAAARAADTASGAAERAQARVDEAQARAQEAGAKTSMAADCAKTYLSTLGSLFSGDDIRTQVTKVRGQLQGIAADCKTALAGSSSP